MFDLCNIYVIYICGNVKNISRITSLSFTTVINFVESNWGNLTSCTVKHFKIFIKVIFLCKLPHTETFFFIYFTWISQKFKKWSFHDITADLVTFPEKILDGKLRFFSSGKMEACIELQLKNEFLRNPIEINKKERVCMR